MPGETKVELKRIKLRARQDRAGRFMLRESMTSPDPTATLSRLVALLPAGRVMTGPAQLAAYESDGLTAFQTRPLGVVAPETQAEVVEVVRFCHREKLPFVARGSGTSLSGGSMPFAGGIVITLNRLNKILKLDPEQRIAVVEAGVVNLAVTAAAQPYGLHYAPDPSSQSICTIGGNVAFNAGGAHCLKYGMTSNHVLGLKAVLATGEVVEFGGPSREQVGPDWTGLFVGNEGLFGIALEVTVQLLPRAEMFHTVLVGYKDIEQAGEAVSAVIASGLLPGAIEIMDALALEAAVAAVHADYPANCAAVLIVELEGPREGVAADRKRLDEVLAQTSAVEIRVARDAAERLAIWKGRKSAFSAVGRLSPDFIVQDGVVPRRKLGEALRKISGWSREMGVRCANVFHAGDGNLHPLILYDGREHGALERAEALAGKILRMCIDMGGSITGEHGVGMEKREYLGEMFSPDEIAFMHRLRAAFDPLGIANPGKMFPSASAPALSHPGLHPLEKAGVISRQ
jgi:glycolate oxidase